MDTYNFSVYFLFYPNIKLTLEKTNFSNSLMRKPQPLTIPCPFFVGRVKRQRNPTHLLGYGYRHTMANATLRGRERASTQPTNQDFFQFGQGID